MAYDQSPIPSWRASQPGQVRFTHISKIIDPAIRRGLLHTFYGCSPIDSNRMSAWASSHRELIASGDTWLSISSNSCLDTPELRQGFEVIYCFREILRIAQGFSLLIFSDSLFFIILDMWRLLTKNQKRTNNFGEVDFNRISAVLPSYALDTSTATWRLYTSQC